MVEIRIDNTGNGTLWLYGKDELWKKYVGCESFDEEVVLTGNRECSNYIEASWYQNAKDILEDIDCYDEYPEELSLETKEKLKELYDNCRRTEDIIFDVIKLLYPNDTFKSGTIRGYYQSDWQNYIIKGNVNVNLLESFYFDKVVDVTIDNILDTFTDVITHDELCKAEREGLKEYLMKKYEISESEEVRIFQADGMKKVIDWKEIK